jgi:hypothetical protein
MCCTCSCGWAGWTGWTGWLAGLRWRTGIHVGGMEAGIVLGGGKEASQLEGGHPRRPVTRVFPLLQFSICWTASHENISTPTLSSPVASLCICNKKFPRWGGARVMLAVTTTIRPPHTHIGIHVVERQMAHGPPYC